MRRLKAMKRIQKAPSEYAFDVCLSFAGEDRLLVKEVAGILKRSGLSVFYDDFEKIQLWGKDLYTHLYEVYSRSARLCVIFFSRSYSQKAWTRHELRAAQARALRERVEYMLPVRISQVEMPQEFETTGFLKSSGRDAAKIAHAVINKFEEHLKKSGYLTEEQFVAELNKGLSQDLILNSLMDGLSSASTPELGLSRALLLVIYLTQDEVHNAIKGFYSYLLSSFPPLAAVFNHQQQAQVLDAGGGFRRRVLGKDGRFQILMKESFWPRTLVITPPRASRT